MDLLYRNSYLFRDGQNGRLFFISTGKGRPIGKYLSTIIISNSRGILYLYKVNIKVWLHLKTNPT